MLRSSKIIIASNSEQVRAWWCQHLSGYAVEGISRLSELRFRILDGHPLLLVVDLELEGLDRIEGMFSLLGQEAQNRVVALAEFPEQLEGMEAIKSGAHGYVGTRTDGDLIQRCIEAVRQGDLWVSRSILQALVYEFLSIHLERKAGLTIDERLRPLTGREKQIAEMIGAGARNKDISEALQITESTVKAHLTAIFRKLGLINRVQLALMLARSCVKKEA